MQSRKKENAYNLKIDDLLISLLKSYHNVEVSDVVSFFGERVEEMRVSTPNITPNCKTSTTYFNSKLNKTVNMTHGKSDNKKYMSNFSVSAPIHVLRGFYPETSIPFKMTLVSFDDGNKIHSYAKVKIGNTQHHTAFWDKEVRSYNNAVSESILLSSDVKEEDKIKYSYRKYKCMRPKEMKLYREKNNG